MGGGKLKTEDRRVRFSVPTGLTLSTDFLVARDGCDGYRDPDLTDDSHTPETLQGQEVSPGDRKFRHPLNSTKFH